MKNRLFVFLSALLIGFNFVILSPDESVKKDIHNKVALAIEYYRDKASYYYRKLTGQIPPAIVSNHYREWLYFEFLCDALLLNPKESENLFVVYIRSRIEIIETLRRTQQPNSPRISRRGGFERSGEIQAMIIDTFQAKVKDRFSMAELVLMKEILTQQWMIPDLDLRAFRMIALNENQRNVIQPLSTDLIRAQCLPYPTFSAKDILEEDREKIAQAKERFMKKVSEQLTDEQLQYWKTKYPGAQQEIDSFSEYQRYRSNLYTGRPTNDKRNQNEISSKT